MLIRTHQHKHPPFVHSQWKKGIFQLYECLFRWNLTFSHTLHIIHFSTSALAVFVSIQQYRQQTSRSRVSASMFTEKQAGKQGVQGFRPTQLVFAQVPKSTSPLLYTVYPCWSGPMPAWCGSVIGGGWMDSRHIRLNF